MDISDKNIYENIINFADNRTILNMLSVNKKFNDPIFFEKVIDRKYHLLKQFKEKNESWRQFFVKMAYYIAKLEEEYDIPYIPSRNYNPEEFYEENNYEDNDDENIDIYDNAMNFAAEGGDLKIVKQMIKKLEETDQEPQFDWAMESAVMEGHLDIVKYLIEKGSNDFSYFMGVAAYEGHLNIVKLMIEKGEEMGTELDLNRAMGRAAEGGHLNIVKLMIEKGEEINQELDFINAMSLAAKGGHTEIVKYLKEKVGENNQVDFIPVLPPLGHRW